MLKKIIALTPAFLLFATALCLPRPAAAQTFTVLHYFEDGTVTNDGYYPASPPIQAKDGNFYGVTYLGGANNTGALYEYNPTTGQVTVLHSFGDGSVTNDGFLPVGSPFQAADRNIYGTTLTGGSEGDGVIYEYDLTTKLVTILHSFYDGSVANDGVEPYGSLVQDANGNFYSTTEGGGVQNEGTIFEYNPTIQQVTILHSFGDGTVINDGSNPEDSLLLASDGNLYGTAVFGGRTEGGTIFEYNTNTGQTSTLHSFGDGTVTNDGRTPFDSLIQATDGNLYGTTYQGGSANVGTIFEYNTTNQQVGILHSFDDGSVANDGGNPYANLIQASDGNLYGTAGSYGAYEYGTVFEYNMTSHLETTLYSFDDTDGSLPYGGLTQGADGLLYGTTLEGGVSTYAGTLFSLTLATPPATNVSGQVQVSVVRTSTNAITHAVTYQMSLTNTSETTVAGPIQVVVGNIPAGVTLSNATGTALGDPYVTVSANALSAGASVGFSITFADPARVATNGFTTQTYSGSF